MADKNSTLNKIKKLFALAGNNPSEQEAQSAMLKAQELLLANGLSMEDVGSIDESDSVDEVSDEFVGQNWNIQKWQVAISAVIARNMRCEPILSYGSNVHGRQVRMIRIVGMSKDVAAAKEVVIFANSVVPNLWKTYRHERRRQAMDDFGVKGTKGLGKSVWDVPDMRKAYMAGFVTGLKEQFAEQVRSKALMIVTSQAVMERTRKIVGKRNKPYDITMSGRDHIAHERGYTDGRSFARPHERLA